MYPHLRLAGCDPIANDMVRDLHAAHVQNLREFFAQNGIPLVYEPRLRDVEVAISWLAGLRATAENTAKGVEILDRLAENLQDRYQRARIERHPATLAGGAA